MDGVSFTIGCAIIGWSVYCGLDTIADAIRDRKVIVELRGQINTVSAEQDSA